tara:strand:+ start:2443 stop:2946 length:504 start_codon:yes stop_codon:yes gene_type:complete
MPTQKLQPSRALPVIPSDDANVPTPNLLVSGTTTSVIFDYQLIDSNANFIITTPTGVQYTVNVGDVVNTSFGAATIIEVVNATTLNVNAGIFGLSSLVYSIYQEGAQTGLFNQGAVLYIGGAGNLKVTTSGNDIVTFAGIQAGTFFPVNVVKVWATGTDCTEIIALW